MEYVYVYRIENDILGFKNKTEIPLGVIFERRKKERGYNYIGMLHMARREFAEKPTDRKNIYIRYKYHQYS